jgi:hypothetical protein
MAELSDADLYDVPPPDIAVDQVPGRAGRSRRALVAGIAAILVVVAIGGFAWWSDTRSAAGPTAHTHAAALAMVPDDSRSRAGYVTTGPASDLLSYGPESAGDLQELGLSVQGAGFGAVFGLPPDDVAVISGVDGDASVEDALTDPAEWDPPFEPREYGGVTFWSRLDDLVIGPGMEHSIENERSNRVAVAGGAFVRAHSDGAIEAMIEVLSGGHPPTLADDPAYRRAARFADKWELAVASFTDPATLGATVEGGDPAVIDRPVLVMSGANADLWVVAAIYESGGDAQENLDAVIDLRDELPEELARGIEVTVDGPALVVTDSGDGPDVTQIDAWNEFTDGLDGW